jgi:hypothetical protein
MQRLVESLIGVIPLHEYQTNDGPVYTTPNPDIEKIFIENGWENISTGGGCDAYSKELPGGQYWMVTSGGGAEIPTKFREQVIVTKLNDQGSEVNATTIKLGDFIRAGLIPKFESPDSMDEGR